jgi:DNA-binding MarR family transcriptional regulator
MSSGGIDGREAWRKLESRGAGSARRALVQALNQAAREASGLGVLFGEAAAVRLGVSHSDAECLAIVLAGDGVTAGEIAASTGLTTGAVTGVVDRLEKAGLARRERDPTDRRKVRVRVTAAAQTRAAALYGPFGTAIDRIAARYS